MTRRVKRTEDFEITLDIGADQFLQTPRPTQRNWLLNRVMKEAADELEFLHQHTQAFVSGRDIVADQQPFDRSQKSMSSQQIMEDWQIPVMQAMAAQVTAQHGDVLEIGFGRGIASDFIQQAGVSSHTIVECNETVIADFPSWRNKFPEDRDIRLVPGMWQDVIDSLGRYDGLFFHTNPLTDADFIQHVNQSATYAEHFFADAVKHLKPGGIFTYLTTEDHSINRAHQRALLKHFSSFTISLLTDLDIPEDTLDAMWSNSVVLVEVRK